MREVCNAEWDDIQDRLREKDTEIERLKFLNQEERQTIEDLSRLCTRAADALQLYADYPIGMVMSVTLRERARGIIAELRKAAE